MVLLNADDALAEAGDVIVRVGSLGADNAFGGTGYDADLDVHLADSLEIIISGRVYELDEDGQRTKPDKDHVTVRLYRSLNGVVSPEELTLDDASQSVTFSGTTTAGPWYLRAYLDAGDDETPEKKSRIVRVQRSDVFELDLVP